MLTITDTQSLHTYMQAHLNSELNSEGETLLMFLAKHKPHLMTPYLETVDAEALRANAHIRDNRESTEAMYVFCRGYDLDTKKYIVARGETLLETAEFEDFHGFTEAMWLFEYGAPMPICEYIKFRDSSLQSTAHIQNIYGQTEAMILFGRGYSDAIPAYISARGDTLSSTAKLKSNSGYSEASWILTNSFPSPIIAQFIESRELSSPLHASKFSKSEAKIFQRQLECNKGSDEEIHLLKGSFIAGRNLFALLQNHSFHEQDTTALEQQLLGSNKQIKKLIKKIDATLYDTFRLALAHIMLLAEAENNPQLSEICLAELPLYENFCIANQLDSSEAESLEQYLAKITKALFRMDSLKNLSYLSNYYQVQTQPKDAEFGIELEDLTSKEEVGCLDLTPADPYLPSNSYCPQNTVCRFFGARGSRALPASRTSIASYKETSMSTTKVC